MEHFLNLDLETIIRTGGYIGLFSIVFAESGLLIGFFLPGDSLLFTSGILAAKGFLSIWALLPVLFAGAVAGDSIGYLFGKKVGPRIFKREDSLLFHRDNLEKANAFYKKNGPKALILARFIPVIRTFAPILAGVGDMHYPTFLAYNLIGGALWSLGVTLAGYFLGQLIPDIDKYLLPIILGIIVVSLIPPVLEFMKAKRK